MKHLHKKPKKLNSTKKKKKIGINLYLYLDTNLISQVQLCSDEIPTL